MALKLMVENLEGIDAAFHSLYEKSDEGFRLSVDGLDDASGLKKALQSERESNKEAKNKLTELERLRDEAERKAMEENGRFKELSERERTDKLQAQSKYEELQKKVAEKTRDIMVRDLAQSMTSDTVELDIIVRFSADYVSIEGEEVKFSKPIEEIKTEMAKFVRSKANGTNDSGNTKGNGDTTPKTFKERQQAHFKK